MNILIVGCGKVGSRLAAIMSEMGHTVSVIDKYPQNFEQLPEDFDGITTLGNPIDQDKLRAAGIESCDAVAIVTQDDNLNIMVAQIAKEIFGKDNVVTRIFDPAREDIFSHFGLSTVCPTRLTCEAVKTALTEKGDYKTVTIGTSTFAFAVREVPEDCIDRHISSLPISPDELFVGILRADQSFVLSTHDKKIHLKEGDKYICIRHID